MSVLFKKGYEAQREAKEEQDKARENLGKKLWRFFLTAPERGESSNEAVVRFLTEEPINFYEHNIQAFKNGKTTYEQYTCSGEDCPLCADGVPSSFKGAFLVIDRREFSYKDKDGNTKTGKDQVRLFVQGTRVVSQLDRISNRYGLTNREVNIVRMGKGTDTNYTIEKLDKEELTRKEVENALPDKLRDEYDGTMDSLYSIVKEQLLMNTPNGSDDEEEKQDDPKASNNDAIIGVDDEEEKPKVKKLGKRKSLFKSNVENSLKPRPKGNERAKKLLSK